MKFLNSKGDVHLLGIMGGPSYGGCSRGNTIFSVNWAGNYYEESGINLAVSLEYSYNIPYTGVGSSVSFKIEEEIEVYNLIII